VRKQNVKLLSRCGTYTQRFVTPEEAARLIAEGQARRISRQPLKLQLITHAEASDSKTSKSSLSHNDMKVLSSLAPGFIRKLDAAKVKVMSPSAVASLQRLSGWGLLPRNAALENAEQA
jgi:hypothetical protein